MNINVHNPYMNKMIYFEYETGCIPAGSVCYCYSSDTNKMCWVYFKNPILGRNNIKLHIEVIQKHGKIAQNRNM